MQVDIDFAVAGFPIVHDDSGRNVRGAGVAANPHSASGAAPSASVINGVVGGLVDTGAGGGVDAGDSGNDGDSCERPKCSERKAKHRQEFARSGGA